MTLKKKLTKVISSDLAGYGSCFIWRRALLTLTFSKFVTNLRTGEKVIDYRQKLIRGWNV